MSNKTTNISAILQMPTSEKSWVNDSFKAVVTNSRPPKGAAPGRAMLVDPENSSARIQAAFWKRDPSAYEGKIIVVSGAGIKKGDDKNGQPQVSLGEKARVDVFQDTSDGTAGIHKPMAVISVPEAAKPPVALNPNAFREEIFKIQLLWLHCYGAALNARELVRMCMEADMTDDQLQSCTASIFIEANRRGLASNPPPLSPKSSPAGESVGNQ